MMRAIHVVAFSLCSCLVSITPALAQAPGEAPVTVPAMQPVLERRVCPGDPDGNLGSIDCSFTPRLRLQEFVGGSVTDQSMLSAAFFGLVAHVRDDPKPWDSGWEGLGRRVGSRYVQSVAKGATEYAIGAVMGTDPRHVSYASDPRITNRQPGVGPRLRHAFMDWLTVRRSQIDAKGRPLPNVSLFAGAAVSGWLGNEMYPSELATRQRAIRRMGSSLATALAASVFNEFQPEVGRVLGGLFKRGRAPAPTPQSSKAVPK